MIYRTVFGRAGLGKFLYLADLAGDCCSAVRKKSTRKLKRNLYISEEGG
jgi:hypothetical protein